jgi:hypothetical protein
MSDIEIIKDILINESGIDINIKTKKREVIEMRGLFYKVVKILKPNTTFGAIGGSVGFNHATVMHSLNMFDVYSTYNKELNRLKDVMINRYKLEHKFYAITSIDDEIKRLEDQINLLREHKENLEKEKELFGGVN